MKDSIASKVYGKSLLAFLERAFRSVNGGRLDVSQGYINYIVFNLEKFLRGDIEKLLVNLPGRHLKTFICSVCLPAFMLGLDPTLKFMVVAYGEELAEDVVRCIREIMETSWYKAVFTTRIAAGHSRKDDFTVIGGGRVRAVSVRSVTGKGGDIVIFDDPHNVADWDNDRQKAKVIEAFELLMSRRDSGAMSQMLVVGHRVAEDDLSAHILERGDFEHVCLPLYAPKEMSFDMDGGLFRLAKGEALRPDAFPPTEIASLRRNHQGTPFWLYYQQGLGRRRDDFQIDVTHFPFLERFSLGDYLATGVPVVLSVDPAQTTDSTSRNVIHVYGMQAKGRYDLLAASAEKCSYRRLLNRVKYYAGLYQANLVLVEKTARGGDLIDDLGCDLAIEIKPVKPRGTKMKRFRAIAAIIRARQIRIRNRVDLEEAVNEIVAFPNGPNDDHVDTMTNFLSAAAKFKPGCFARVARRPRLAGVLSSRNTAPVPYTPGKGMAIVRSRSIFSPQTLPDFSTGRAEARPGKGPRSPFAAEDSQEPIYGYDGEKMVRLK
jgi:predicted phage terminase large subunit-like protein